MKKSIINLHIYLEQGFPTFFILFPPKLKHIKVTSLRGYMPLVIKTKMGGGG